MSGRPSNVVGIERLSITPAVVGNVNAMIRSLDLEELRADMPAILAHPASNPRGQYQAWAEVHRVDLGN